MKNTIVMMLLLVSAAGIQSCSNSSDPSAWSEDKLTNWFGSGDYLNGWNAKPDASVNKREFAIAYFNNKERWDKAFEYLRTTDLKALEVKRYDIDGDNLYALVSEYITKNEEDVRFEAHRKYIDIQYVIYGSEQISVAVESKKGEVLTPYDDPKDLEFMTVTESSHCIANSGNFFLFFPADLHRPGVKSGDNAQVKKVVLKLKI